MMKKLFCVLALGMALVACEESPIEEVDPTTRTVTFCAGFDQTRTILIDKTFYWDFDDEIGGFATGNTNVSFKSITDRNGWFEGSITGDPTEFYLYYPYNKEEASISGSVITTTLHKTQKLVAGSTHDVFPMVAVTDNIESDKPIKFYNTCGVVRFAVKSNIARTIKSLTFTAADENAVVWGTGTIDMSNVEEATMVMSSAANHNSVELTPAEGETGVEVKAGEVTYFYVVLPPATYKGGFDVTLTDAAGKSVTADAQFFGDNGVPKDLKITRNKLINVSKVIEFNSTGSVALTSVNAKASNTDFEFKVDETYDTLFVANKAGYTNVKAAKLTLGYTSVAEGQPVEPTIKINGEDYSADKTYDLTMPLTIELTCADVTKQYTVKLSQLTDTGLPVVYVNTPIATNNITKEWTEGCQIYIDAKGRQSWDGTETFEDFAQLECEFKGRGNSTWAWAKKPYAIKLDSKEPVLGMDKHKRWVLLANLIDKSMMRNIVAFMLAETVYSAGKSEGQYVWTPRGHSVELVLNGEHKGNYLLCEQIKIDEKRVNAGKFVNESTEGGQGYIIEADRLWGSDKTETLWWNSYRRYTNYGLWSQANFSGSYYGTFDETAEGMHDMYYDPNTNNYLRTYHSAYSTYYNTSATDAGNGYGMTFGLKDPDDGDLGSGTAGQSTNAFLFIKQRLTDIEKIVFNITGPYYSWENGGTEYLKELEKYIDIDSFVDYFIINEVTMNHELNNAGSVYMYYNANDGLIYAGPVWDFDNTAFKDAAGRGDGYQFIVRNSLWYCQLLWCDAFISKVQDRWEVVKPLMLAKLPSILTMRTHLEKSAEYNWAMWNIQSAAGQDPNNESDMSYSDAAYDIYENVEARITYLNELILGTNASGGKGHFTCGYDDID